MPICDNTGSIRIRSAVERSCIAENMQRHGWSGEPRCRLAGAYCGSSSGRAITGQLMIARVGAAHCDVPDGRQPAVASVHKAEEGECHRSRKLTYRLSCAAAGRHRSGCPQTRVGHRPDNEAPKGLRQNPLTVSSSDASSNSLCDAPGGGPRRGYAAPHAWPPPPTPASMRLCHSTPPSARNSPRSLRAIAVCCKCHDFESRLDRRRAANAPASETSVGLPVYCFISVRRKPAVAPFQLRRNSRGEIPSAPPPCRTGTLRRDGGSH